MDESLAPVTIEGYRSAIDSVWLPASGRTLADAPAIRELIAHFRLERPRSVHQIPRWDLGLVLRFLRLPQFRPAVIDRNPMFFSMKTVFLTLLALARRCSDVHAMDPRRLSYSDRAVIVPPFAGYLPKIRSAAEGAPRYQPMVIRRLSAITSDSEELLLCPARTLLSYHRWAERRSPNRARFFLSTRSDAKPVVKATMASWVKKLVRAAYTQAESSQEALSLAGTRVHEVRAIASSLALQSTFALEDILGAAQWATPSVFASYYLRDVSSFDGHIYSLGSLVVAGQILG